MSASTTWLRVATPVCAVACAWLLAVATAHAQADEFRAIVERLRSPAGACAATAPPMTPQGTLDAAAARIAQGAELGDALRAAGYRATQAQVISVSGPGLRAQLGQRLSGRFCAQIGNAALTELGIHAARDQVWIVLAAPFAPKVDLTRAQVRERMLLLVNQARAEPRRCGDESFSPAQALAWNETLESAAARHAADMATQDYFSHIARDGSSPAQRVARAGYRYRTTGENIASGQLSPETAMSGWLKSPGHCANLMNAAYTEMGVAYAVNADSRMGVYWAQLFGAPR